MIKIEIEIDEGLVPEGYEAVGVSDCVKPGETFLNNDLQPLVNRGDCQHRADWPILILKKKRWRADVGETYWFTTSFNTETMEMEVDSDIEDGGATDEVLWRFGNYYKTKAEAAEAGVRVHKAYLNE